MPFGPPGLAFISVTTEPSSPKSAMGAHSGPTLATPTGRSSGPRADEGPACARSGEGGAGQRGGSAANESDDETNPLPPMDEVSHLVKPGSGPARRLSMSRMIWACESGSHSPTAVPQFSSRRPPADSALLVSRGVANRC